MVSIESNTKSLKLEKKSIKILEENNINTVEKLVFNTKTSLKKMGLSNEQISEIEIKLQLDGYDLNRRKNNEKKYIQKGVQ